MDCSVTGLWGVRVVPAGLKVVGPVAAGSEVEEKVAEKAAAKVEAKGKAKARAKVKVKKRAKEKEVKR